MPSLPDLPTELLVEIIKCYPSLYVYKADALVHGVYARQISGERPLRSLSQTCRLLRRIFLPVLWARIYAGPWRKEAKPKNSGGKTVERFMRGIRRTAYVVPYIQCLSVSMQESTMQNWELIAEFIRVLRILPNLRTLTILGIPSAMMSTFCASFSEFSFPSVTSLVLPDRLAPVIRHFPNVRTLTNARDVWGDFGTGQQLLSEAEGRCKQLRTINNLVPTQTVANYIRQAIPGIQSLSIWQTTRFYGVKEFPEFMRSIEGMDNLSELTFRYGLWLDTPETPYHLSVLGQIAEAGKRALRTSKASRRKELCIQYMKPGGGIVQREKQVTVEA
ncbi:hypothetical protein MVEN_01710300 [Mycena venus]|uniref:F-box domain-containing protein n=1 Tax=Mycena venus TaxID=2733690 RepID=A0A8H6XMW8_9AGAR|nr:hypothetical protein MVEN_01710300 [Mycena venus]